MKVILVHKCFYKKGGAEVFFFEVARILKEHGHEVAMFSCNDNLNESTEWSNYFIDAPDFKTSNIFKKIKALISIPYNFSAKRKFAELLDNFKPDIVHCFNIMTQISPSVMAAARERNIPVVISHNDYKHICPNYMLYHDGKTCNDCKNGCYLYCLKNKCSHGSLSFSLASTIEAYIHKWMKVYQKNVTLHLFSCNYMADITEQFWKRRINRGTLLNPFDVPDAPTEYGSGSFGLYFGRLIEEKGVDVLLKALSIANNIRFTIVGNGPAENYLKQMSDDLGLSNVEFVGPKWGKELEFYLNNAKYVVVPSVWQENFPYVILQAFAACKPVIGSKRGGIPEMVSEERGYLYEADDYKQLAELMIKLDSNPNCCKKMGMAARDYVENTFSDKLFYKSVEDNYIRAIQLKMAK